MATPKLKKLIENIVDEFQIDEQAFLENVKGYSNYGKLVYREGNLSEIAKNLSEIAKVAGIHAVKETADNFDKITVSRNMKELTNLSKQFGKVAMEANSLQERMSGLYEDMGHILGRYYTIGEADASNDDAENVDEADKMMFREEDDYKAFFKKAMQKFNVTNIEDLSDSDKKDFFNYVDRNYKAKNEIKD